MAKHNQVILNGQVSSQPKLVYDDDGKTIKRVMFGVEVLHGNRDFGNEIDKVKYDVPLVFATDPAIIQKVKNFQKGDIVEIKGTITTKDVVKRTVCKFCGHQHSKLGNVVCITPIFAEVREKGLNDEKGKKIIRDRCEISNLVTVIAPLCREPMLYVTEKGTPITTYQLAIRRKYYIKDSAKPDVRTDFPWVKSYGHIAQNDAKSLKKGSYVFIDGLIQVRQLRRYQECEECGKTYEWTDSATEIVPYAVEYLRDFYSVEEIQAREKEESLAAIQQVFNEDEISLNRPSDVPDFNDYNDSETQKDESSDTANDVLN